MYTKSFNEPELNKKEMLRYAKSGALDDVTEKTFEEVLSEMLPLLKYNVVWDEYDIHISGNRIDMGFSEIESADLARNLIGCSKIILFAATVGIGPDRLIRKYSAASPVKAVFAQAIGAERIESLCDVFNSEITDGMISRPRYSPGYGDVPLTFQKEVFRALNPEKYIGITLNDSLLMTPSKSVTAIIGIEK